MSEMINNKETLEQNIVGENGIGYTLGTDGLYYPDLELPEGSHYDIGKYGIMRMEYLAKYRRQEYIKLLLTGELNEYLYEVEQECHARVERMVEQMKAGAGIAEEMKKSDQMKWVGLMNNVRNEAEEIVVKGMIVI